MRPWQPFVVHSTRFPAKTWRTPKLSQTQEASKNSSTSPRDVEKGLLDSSSLANTYKGFDV